MAAQRFVSPQNIAELQALLGQNAVPVGGAAGLMSAAMPSRLGALNADLDGLGLAYVSDDKVGAMTRLADLHFNAPSFAGRQAVGQAIGLTANPAVRRLITFGGVLGGRSHRADLPVALAVHGAEARIVTGTDAPSWHPVLGLWDLREPFTILEVHLGQRAPSCYVRWSGHQEVAPAVVSVAGALREDGSIVLCLGAALPVPRICAPGDLPARSELLDDALGSSAFRFSIMQVLVEQTCRELTQAGGS